MRSAQAFLKRTKQKSVVIQHFEDSFFPYNGSEIKRFMQELSSVFFSGPYFYALQKRLAPGPSTDCRAHLERLQGSLDPGIRGSQI